MTKRLIVLATAFVSFGANAQRIITAVDITVPKETREFFGVKDPLDGSVKNAAVCLFRYGAKPYERVIAKDTKMKIEDLGQPVTGPLELGDVNSIIFSVYSGTGAHFTNLYEAVTYMVGTAGIKVFDGPVTKKRFRLTWKRGNFATMECYINNPDLIQNPLSVTGLIDKIGVAADASRGEPVRKTLFAIPPGDFSN